MIYKSILVFVLAFTATIMLLSIQVEVVQSKSLRENIQQQMQTNDNPKYYWIGTSPWCGGECQDCYDNGDGCLVLASITNFIPPEYKDKADFGKLCGPGNKALCGPKELDTGNYWVGTAPHCAGSCDDCTKDGATCLTTASAMEAVAEEYKRDSYKFGIYCATGKKALCKKN